ncbi:Crp/Fnr family transcriptional regulator [Flavivirga aquatica]|uniref:Crp/Fnr family transcriptional regulator n=1 Tax=Flavivirga aquatica TaxID=1849968 RepID=A0A1E5TA92_9FLAO|nr:Crp/Fnr family transcriptional regulator [Flavivirga aquatica]OEK08284.1 Crp/Fnr family transcriptional regulator [Flavivirga aquatica]
MNIIKVSKGEIIQRSGDLNTKIYFVNTGLLRSYTIDDKGKEYIYQFAPEKWIIADLSSPTEPCQLFIDALENSEITVIQKDPQISFVDEVKLKNRMKVLQNRIIMLMSSSALERYIHFQETYPNIVLRTTQKMVASYLGITPEALSRVRHKISQTK